MTTTAELTSYQSAQFACGYSSGMGCKNPAKQWSAMDRRASHAQADLANYALGWFEGVFKRAALEAAQ